MRVLIIFTVFLGFLTFLFSNYIIPISEYNFSNLRKNIAKVKPTMAIAEGQFSQIGNYNIKVENKYGVDGRNLENIIIHQKKQKAGNYTVIKSNKGKILSSDNSNILKLVLFDGYYYDEIISDEYKNKTNKPFIKSKFKEYVINIDIGKINQIDFDEVNDINQYSMMNINELDFAIDSLKKKREIDIDVIESKMITRSNYKTLDYNLNPKEGIDYFNKDFFRLFQLKKQKQLFDLGISSIKSSISIIKSNKTIQLYRTQNLNKHIITLHDKFSLGFACVILFFIGAPLGTIINKGGYGLPLVISILLFLVYHFLGIFSKNLAEDGSINPILSSWLSTIIMLPISVYLTHRATNDGSSNKLYSFFINLLNPNK
jgi:lipopolysaccharide export system permease protein